MEQVEWGSFIPKFVKCDYEQNKTMTVGQIESGEYVLIASNKEGTAIYSQMTLNEDAFFELLKLMAIYTKHYDLDFVKKIAESSIDDKLYYISPNENE